MNQLFLRPFSRRCVLTAAAVAILTEMLEWVTSGPGARLGLIVHHTDADREWAYDRGSPVGRLERGLDEAAARRWVVVDMKQDWKVIYPEEARP